MKFELVQRQTQTTDILARLEIVPDYLGKVYEMIDYWDSQPKLELTLNLRGQDQVIQFVYAPPAFLDYIEPGELFGAYLGNMIFINSEIGEKHPDWVPYIVLKLWSERYVDQGLDETGRVKHMQSLWATIRFAGTSMQADQLREFLEVLIKHDRSGYFKLDEEVRSFIEKGGGDPKTAKRQYLENHHDNLWVVRGRFDEDLVSAFGISAFDGYRNHAEAIMSVLGELETKDLYTAAVFLHQLARLEPGTEVVICPPFNAFAYALTKDCNGFTDLIKFADWNEGKPGEDLICRLPSNRKTWQALSKRISYRIHKAEEKVRALISGEQKRLSEAVSQADLANQEIARVMDQAQTMIAKPDGFDQARTMLLSAGSDFQQTIAALQRVSTTTSENLQRLSDISRVLAAQI